MRRLLAVLLIAAAPGFAWSPKKLFQGRTGYVVSCVALAAAHFADYRTTERGLNMGLVEANPVLKPIVIYRERFIAFKVTAGAIPIVAGAVVRHKRPELANWTTATNWAIAIPTAAIAAHNEQLIRKAGQ